MGFIFIIKVTKFQISKFNYFTLKGLVSRFNARIFHSSKLLICAFFIHDTLMKSSLFLTPFYFLLPNKVFLGRTYKMEIWMVLEVLKSPETENHIFSGWSIWLCVCVCASVISITPNHITSETQNSVFYICFKCRCYLKIFKKVGQIFWAQDAQKF